MVFVEPQSDKAGGQQAPPPKPIALPPRQEALIITAIPAAAPKIASQVRGAGFSRRIIQDSKAANSGVAAMMARVLATEVLVSETMKPILVPENNRLPISRAFPSARALCSHCRPTQRR